MLLSGSSHLFQCTCTEIKIYKGLIEPHFYHCSAIWDGLTQLLSEKLKNLQSRAIRVIIKSSYDTSSRFLLNLLGCDNLSVRRAKQKVNAKKKLMPPKPKTDYLKRSFSDSGALLWNNPSEEIRTSNSLVFFKRSTHRWFSDQYSHTANM